MTYCIWAHEEPERLLPKTDFIIFVSAKSSEKTGRIIIPPVPWESAVEVVGHLMESTDYAPPRFKVSSVPSDAELAQLVTKADKKFADFMKPKGAAL